MIFLIILISYDWKNVNHSNHLNHINKGSDNFIFFRNKKLNSYLT